MSPCPPASAPDPGLTRTGALRPDEQSTAGAPTGLGASGQDPDPQPGQRLAHYRLLEPLGAGGFGAVWRAEDLRLGREVALKFLARRISRDSAARSLLEAEARTVAALAHPGIVTLHALEEAEGRLFLVMERVAGQQLGALIPAGGMSLDRVVDLGVQLGEALAAAHALGIVHRDLNPRNIMVGPEGRARILDFGLALRQASRAEGPAAPGTGSGSDGRLTGTLPYMSPEQIRGQALDGRSDLFSLGVLLFEAAFGSRPFHGDTAAALMDSILEGEPEWPTESPARLKGVLGRCLEKDPDRRFATARSFLAAFELLRGAQESSPSLAVLPFRDLSPEGGEIHFCEGLAEELISALGRVPGLRVLSRAASFSCRDAGLELPELGRRLGVGRMVEGSVRIEAGRVRVRVELVDLASGYALWSSSFERERAELRGLEEVMAEEVAAALNLVLPPSRRLRRPVHPEAYEDLLRGRQYYFRYNRQSMRFALQLFQQALERQPDYGEAWAGVANCAAFLYIYADRTEAHRRQAEEASQRALELDPELAEAHASRGVALSAAGRAEEAARSFERALELDPDLYEAAYFFARHCFATGDLGRAVSLFERAARLNPEDCQAILLVAQVHVSLGDPEAAEAARRRGVALAEERLRRVPDDVRTRYLAANALVALGERERGLAWARMARSLAPDDPMVLYNLGCIHALALDPETAIDCLEEAVRAGLTQRGWFLHDGDLDPLRGHARFQALLAALPDRSGHS